MTEPDSTPPARQTAGFGWIALAVAITVLALAAAVALAVVTGPSGGLPGMMGDWPAGAMMAGPPRTTNGQPGGAGFVAGTPSNPRIIRLTAGPGPSFWPASVVVAPGETVTFVVTTMGPTVHEFMVGPAAAVAADDPGTPEVEDITMMATRTLTYTFDGPGPYAYACHEPGHYEAGMRGTISVAGA